MGEGLPEMPDPVDLIVPQLGEPLPYADLAQIDPAKLCDYALDPENPIGKHKAAVFEAAMRISLEDWEYLRFSILSELPRCVVSRVREPARPDERYTWEVLVPISGLKDKSERTLLVITAWEMIEDHPALITLRVAPKARQPTT